MSEKRITLTRRQIYNEIWDMGSIKKVAELNGIPYHKLQKACKEANIPTPPPGYETSMLFGKSIEKPELDANEESELLIFSIGCHPQQPQVDAVFAENITDDDDQQNNDDVDSQSQEQEDDEEDISILEDEKDNKTHSRQNIYRGKTLQ